MKKSLLVLVLCLMPIMASAQHAVNMVGLTYTEDFASLPSTAASQCNIVAYSTLNPSPLPTNWSYTAAEDGRDAIAAVSNWGGPCDGTGASGAIFSHGSIGATDRALGSLGSGTPENQYYGFRMKNMTGSTLAEVTLNYTGEQWRAAASANGDTLVVSFQVGATVTDLTAGTWVEKSNCKFVTPQNNAAAASSLDGNLAANRTAVSCKLVPGGGWANGQEMMIRFFDKDDAGSDNAVAIDDLTISTSLTTAREVEDMPQGYALSAAYPNPFSQEAQFEVTLQEAQNVKVTVFDLTGREVATLHNGILEAGTQSFKVNGATLPAGLYLYNVQGDTFRSTKSVMLVK